MSDTGPDAAADHARLSAYRARLDARLAEYAAIRAEVLQALQGQQSVLNFGASTLSVGSAPRPGRRGDMPCLRAASWVR